MKNRANESTDKEQDLEKNRHIATMNNFINFFKYNRKNIEFGIRFYKIRPMTNKNLFNSKMFTHKYHLMIEY